MWKKWEWMATRSKFRAKSNFKYVWNKPLNQQQSSPSTVMTFFFRNPNKENKIERKGNLHITLKEASLGAHAQKGDTSWSRINDYVRNWRQRKKSWM